MYLAYRHVWITRVQSNLVKGRIAFRSTLAAAAANSFVRLVTCVCWAGTFACGGKRTMQNHSCVSYVSLGRHTSPSKVPLPVAGFKSPSNTYGSFSSQMFASRRHFDRYTPFLHTTLTIPIRGNLLSEG